MTEGKNFTNQNPPSIIDTEYRRCNFTQHVPARSNGKFVGKRLFLGDDTPRTFISCNLCNVEVPVGSTIIDCNTTIKRFKLNTEVDRVTIDGDTISHQHHADFVYGRQTAPGVYEYKPTPERQDQD